MSQVRIEGKEYPIKKIFSNDFEFEIPLYQRPYSWNPERAEALLNDLLLASIEDEKKVIDELEPYFLGCIVLIKENNKSKASIVDGQQRITTLTILLSALRATLPKRAEDLGTFIYQKGNQISGEPNRYRLSLRERDNKFFKDFIQDESGIEKLKDLNENGLNDAQKLIKANAMLFMDRLQGSSSESENHTLNLMPSILDEHSLVYTQKIPEAQRTRLAEFIVQRCFLVVVSTPTLETAYRIFSILNDRGFNISLPDILKAEIIGKIQESKQEIYTRKWEEIEESLGRDGFTELFSHIRTIRRKTKLGKNILEELRDYVISPISNSEVFIEKLLQPYADAFNKIKKPNERVSKEAKKLFYWLNQIDNFDWLPPAIFYLSNPERTEEEILIFFTKLERLAACLMIARANVNYRVRRYGNLLLDIESTNPSRIDRSLQLTCDEQEKTIKYLDGDIYLMDKIRRYVLLRLDAELSTGGASYDYDVITIEHVLPQSPSPGSEWVKLFPNKEERNKKYLHRLGNLVLLTTQKNSKAQNFAFRQKKDIYFNENNISPFALTIQVLQENEWTPEIIERRQNDLLKILKDLWRLESLESSSQQSLFDIPELSDYA